MLVIDLFGGCGGAAIGLQRLGLQPWSYERDADCVATLRAAGHRVVQCDLGTYEWDDGWRGEVGVLHGSPPCQPWSASGLGRGAIDHRDGMPYLLRAVEALQPLLVTVENVEGLTYTKHRGYLGWFLTSLSALGYEVGWRVLNTANYGVPQTRKRLIIVGRSEGAVRWPRATHAKGGAGELEPWVPMATALSWDPSLWVLNTGNDWKPGLDRRHAQKRSLIRPAPSITGKSGGQWVLDRPATTVSGDTRIHPPGHRANADYDGHPRRGPDAYRLTVAELAALQDLPAEYPLQGTKTSQVRQVGNALPPTLLQAVVGANMWPPAWAPE